jgi:cytochrome c5
MLLFGFAFVVGCGRPAGEGSAARPDRAVGNVAKEEATTSAALSDDARARVERFCGDCHGLPTPGSFPHERWPKEVRQGYDFYLASLRTDLPRPPEGEAIRYFQDSAPERIEVPRAADRIEPPSPVNFVPIELLPGADAIDPAIAQVIAIPGSQAGGTTLGLLTTDMRSGEIRRWQLSGAGAQGQVIARLSHPCRVAPAKGAAEGFFVGDLR